MEVWASKPFIHGIIYGSARLVRCEDPLAEESKRLRTLLFLPMRRLYMVLGALGPSRFKRSTEVQEEKNFGCC